MYLSDLGHLHGDPEVVEGDAGQERLGEGERARHRIVLVLGRRLALEHHHAAHDALHKPSAARTRSAICVWRVRGSVCVCQRYSAVTLSVIKETSSS